MKEPQMNADEKKSITRRARREHEGHEVGTKGTKRKECSCSNRFIHELVDKGNFRRTVYSSPSPTPLDQIPPMVERIDGSEVSAG